MERLLIALVALIVFCFLAIWLIGMLPLPEPWHMIARVLIVLAALVVLYRIWRDYGHGV